MNSSNGAQTLVVAKHCPNDLQPDAAGWCLNDFVLVKKLGVGGASAVYQAIHRRSRACVALKLYFKSKLTALNTHQVQREVTIHSRLNHPSIISLVRPSAASPRCVGALPASPLAATGLEQCAEAALARLSDTYMYWEGLLIVTQWHCSQPHVRSVPGTAASCADGATCQRPVA